MLVRKATFDDIPAIARVHVNTYLKTYKDIIPEQFLANQSYKKRKTNWEGIFDRASDNSNFIYVAENKSKQIVGFAHGGSERESNPIYQGELYAIYILPNYQQRGIGRNLWQMAIKKLNQMEIDSLLVWVLADNPACQFYESLGGVIVDSKSIKRGDKTLREIAYGWLNTVSMMNQ